MSGIKTASKFLSLVLRHKPETIGIQIDNQGWTDVEILIRNSTEHGVKLNMEILKEIVDSDEKGRYSFNDDQTRIRANQGHSLEIDLNLNPVQPPDSLYHGTATRFQESIQKQGLLKGQRHHVHMSDDHDKAIEVGKRYGKPIVAVINAKAMYADGYNFYLSKNGVWLTDHVPTKYIFCWYSKNSPDKGKPNA